MGYSRLISIACGVVFLGGCFGGGDDETKKTSFEDAAKYDLPKSLKDDIATNPKTKESYMMNPLEQQLEALKNKAEQDRKMLAMNADKAEEFKRRADELRGSLQNTESKIIRVNKIINMINDDPSALREPMQTAGNGAYNDVPRIGSSGPLGAKPTFNNELPALGGGSGNILSGGPEATYNNFSGSASAVNKAKDEGSLKPAAWGSLAPAVSNPALAVDGPEFAEDKKSNRWSENIVAEAAADGKVLLSDGTGPDSEYIISLGKKDNITEGMLFEARSVNGKKNVLVVTRVYKANAEAKLHPRFAAGGLKTGDIIRKVTVLPE